MTGNTDRTEGHRRGMGRSKPNGGGRLKTVKILIRSTRRRPDRQRRSESCPRPLDKPPNASRSGSAGGGFEVSLPTEGLFE